MWKKPETDPRSNTPEVPTQPRPLRPEASREVAIIGPSIKIKGNLSGNEDLVIQGRVDGEILLKRNQVTVGVNGKVKADIHGKSIHVEGEVRGDLIGSEEVILRASGKVQGNIVSPRVTLDNGSKFKGSIDMEPSQDPPKATPTPKPESREQSLNAPPPVTVQPAVTDNAPAKLEAKFPSGNS